MRALIWGTAAGTHGLCTLLEERGVEIVGFADRNSGKWGRDYQGYRIYSPDEAMNLEFDRVYIASIWYDEISRGLVKAGVDAENIIQYKPADISSLDIKEKAKFIVDEKYTIKDGEVEIEKKKYRIKGFDDSEGIIGNTEEKRVIVRKVADAYVKATEDCEDVSDPYLVGENWKNVIRHSRGSFFEAVEKRDYAKIMGLLDNFLRNSLSNSIAGGVKALSKGSEAEKVWCEDLIYDFKTWKSSFNQEELPSLKEISIPEAGNPFGINVEGYLLNGDCFRHHYRSRYFNSLLNGCKRPVIGEIGGGYGNFAYYWMRSGANNCYINFDLPENLILCSYFLSVLFPEKRILYYENRDLVLDADLISNYDIILMPNFMLPQLADSTIDMFLNTVSLSEMEYPTIEEYIKQINRVTRSYFYHKNLAHMPNGYKGYAADLFPEPENFRLIMTSPSRWKIWGQDSKIHSYKEYLYKRNETCN